MCESIKEKKNIVKASRIKGSDFRLTSTPTSIKLRTLSGAARYWNQVSLRSTHCCPLDRDVCRPHSSDELIV
jgi:hypothetical protein